MIVELRLLQWIEAGLALYRANPLLLEQVFYDAGQVGFPDGLAPSVLGDTTKRWLPNEYAGGTVRYGDAIFPIVSNTEQQLRVTGDPSAVRDTEHIGYQIVPPAVDKLTQLLATETCTVTTSFPLIPTEMPAFTIRLEQDAQGDTYLGEALESSVLQGVEIDANLAQMQGSYLISIWSHNRLETLWLYAWLQNFALRSMQMFAAWGLYDVSLRGSDIDPALQFLPEHTYARHLLLTASRQERAISTQDVAYVTQLYVNAIAHYARFDLTIAAQP